ncbi:MAG: D-sedoheptulose-7-phosphate isomerase [Planctomycetota bacterium]
MTTLSAQLQELAHVVEACHRHDAVLQAAARDLVGCLQAGGKVLTCGNGGSACDADHLAEELLGRYRSNRRALPAVSLSAGGALLTCIVNDFGPDEVFARQVAGLIEARDLLVVFSSSGASQNIRRALDAARSAGARTVAFLGKDGGICKGLATHEAIVPSRNTARIQEIHTVFIHTLCEAVEAAFPETPPNA